jgi:serine/threonine-protein kinase RsbT
VSSGEHRIRIRSDNDVAVAVMQARQQSAAIGFDVSASCRIATAVSELARNILKYAEQGDIVLRACAGAARTGLEVRAEDRGPGIADVELALRDSFSTGRTLGLGLPGVRRLMDEFLIDSRPGEGTRVTARKWL